MTRTRRLTTFAAALLLLAHAAPGRALPPSGRPGGPVRAPATRPGVSARAKAAPSRVILTRYLPPVGDQGNEQSCVGWAFGYACRTYLEARARHWRPDRPSRIFSPAFIYN